MVFYVQVLLLIFLTYNFFALTPYHYVYLNILAGKSEAHSNKFENDYWGISTKKLISKIENNEKISKNSLIKFTTCGIEEKAQIKYLKKINGLKYKMVKNSEDYDFIIMNNRIVFQESENSKKTKTCYEKFSGNDVVSIKSRGLSISKITGKLK